jgi:sugar (pentulose or hexulose) kinase
MTTDSEIVAAGKGILGIELGSTRIKAMLISADRRVLAQGSCRWENRFEGGYWTYGLDEAVKGLRHAYAELAADVRGKLGCDLRRVAALGISGMMHGYLPLGPDGRQLAPFRTWRSTTAARAGEALSNEFGFHVPMRWSVAQLYQAVMEGAPEVTGINRITTLAGWVHAQLTGRHDVGLCEASGIFPVDPETLCYDARMRDIFNARLLEAGMPWKVEDVLPEILPMGSVAGRLTEEGARLLDPTGTLEPGAPACPPEGDVATGMVATDTLSPGLGSVSAGTSVFAMVVLDQPLKRWYPEIDVLATPEGRPVAIVHCNNGSSDIDAWMRLFGEVAEAAGGKSDGLYDRFFRMALEGSADCGGIEVCNFVAAEPLAGVSEGRPSVSRRPDACFTLPNFMRASLTAVASNLKIGLDLLRKKENVRIDRLVGHGGLFKTPGVMEQVMTEVLGLPVTTLSTAGEGGAWGIAVLASRLA